MEVQAFSQILFILLTSRIFLDGFALGDNNGNNNHPTRHHHRHSNKGNYYFSDVQKSQSISERAKNRLHNEVSFEASLRRTIKTTTIKPNANRKERIYPRISPQRDDSSLSFIKTFQTDGNSISEERALNFGGNKTNSFSKKSLNNRTMENGAQREVPIVQGDNTKDIIAKQLLAMLSTMMFSPKHHHRIGSSVLVPPRLKATNETIRASSLPLRNTLNKRGKKSKHPTTSENLSRSERETPPHNISKEKEIVDFENKNPDTSKDKKHEQKNNKKKKMPKLFPLALKASKLHKENGDRSSMFMRHNITVESLNHGRDKERTTKISRDRKKEVASQLSAREEVSSWRISLKDTKGNLNNTSTTIYAQAGGNALLPCRVGHLGDRQVSWIRTRDWFVLTSGNSLYTHDERFGVLHEQGSQDWTLHIKRSVVADSGVYECQVSTGTGIISFFVRLKVVTPTAHIPGNGGTHVYRGSPFTIYCYIVKSASAIQHVIWHHDGTYLNDKRENDDFAIETRVQKSYPKNDLKDDFFEDHEFENGLENDPEKNVVISRLRVDFATEDHSGNYTCSAPNVVPDSTLIYVTEGDKTAAVQRIDSGSSQKAASKTAIAFVTVIIISCAAR